MTPVSPVVPELSRSYDVYISSGLYDERYPRPNRRSLRTMLRYLSGDKTFLDFGAGTGRYTLPLLHLSHASGVAYDICSTAVDTLRLRLREHLETGRITVRSDPVQALKVAYPKYFDLAVLAFGVLGHVAVRDERVRLLRAIREMMKPEGTVLLGLPNGKRRFRAEQRQALPLVASGELEAGDVLYTRGTGQSKIGMYYHLYTREELHQDLARAGLEVESFEPESILAEETVVCNGLIGRIDDLACRMFPPSWAYGFLVVARPAQLP